MLTLLVFVAFDFYLSASLFRPFLTDYPILFWTLEIALQGLILSQVWLYLVFFKTKADQALKFEKPLQHFGFVSMGMISFLFSVTFFRDAFALILLPFGRAGLVYGSQYSFILLGLAALGLAIGCLNAKFRVISPRIEIPIPLLPEGLEGFRIVQLSDVHFGTGPGVKEVKKLIDRTLSLKPDLIVLTGDIVDGMIKDLRGEFAELSRLKAEFGTYFVLGNHECYWKWKDSVAEMEKLGIIPLLNFGVTVTVKNHPIYIGGMNDPAIVSEGGESPRIPVPPTESKFNLMLVHQPQFAKEVAKAPYHLQLSGHTHGGQFFPWNLVVKKIYPISGGLGRVENLWVYVSHGSGYWGPPVRLGTSGEVTELILRSSTEPMQ